MSDIRFYLFPYESINKGERVVIYGAGKVGQSFLHQIYKNDYCKIVCMVDRDYSYLHNCYDSVVSPKELSSMTFDKVIIAIDDEIITRDIREILIRDYKISPDKIIEGNNHEVAFCFWTKNVLNTCDNLAFCHDGISMAFWLSGGLGDCIVAKKIILNLLSMVEFNLYHIDLYTFPESEKYLQILFSDCSFVNRIIPEINISNVDLSAYDVAFHLIEKLSVLNINLFSIMKKNAKFAKIIQRVVKKSETYEKHFGITERNRHIQLCRILGYNYYTFYNYYGIPVDDIHINVPLSFGYRSLFDSMDLQENEFITLNWGWGGAAKGDWNTIHCKVWPFVYYEQLVNLIHLKFPRLKIIQIGAKGSPTIADCDQEIIGQSLELIKYVLKHSLLHIDCEGGMVHLATQLGTKCAVLFGPTPVYYYGYSDNINIVSKHCNNCFGLAVDIGKCVRGLNQPECMWSITPKNVMENIEGYLEFKLREEKLSK